MVDRDGIAKSLLERFLTGRQRPDLDKHSIKHDRWDDKDLQSVIQEMESFAEARKKLGKFAPQSGETLLGDDFISMVKARPQLTPREDMEPTHLLNGVVMEEAMELPEYKKLHLFSVADSIQAGAAAVSMEPKLEELYDRLRTEQETLQKLIDMMGEHEDLAEDLEAIQEQMEAIANGEGAGGGGDVEDPQAQRSLIEEQMRRLEEEMGKAAGEIDDGVEEERPHMQQILRQAFEEAGEEAETAESAAIAWGLDPAGLKRLPPEERIALSEKLDSEKFRAIAKLFGPMNRLAMAEQDRKVYYAADEIFDVEQGNDLDRMLLDEGLRLAVPELLALWVSDYLESGLMQYKLQGVEKVAKGSIILCEDGSGSMGGGREIWAKAVALCLCRITREQKRDFHAIHFGGTGETYEFEFTGSGFNGEVNTHYTGRQYEKLYPDQTFNYIDGMIHFAEVFFGGGTDFVTPLSKALSILQAQAKEKGRVEGDIVFVTDGMCGVSPEWLEEFKEEQAKLGFRVWGILIDEYSTGENVSEPLQSICDGRVFTIADLTSGNEMRDIFRNV